ncbi:MAG: glutamate--tRNA ligase [Nocardioides sp.]
MTDPVLGDIPPPGVRVRFAPSPTGDLFVGDVRSALFNWAFARHHGGTLVLRIEDTDLSRRSHEGYRSVLDSLRWLGLDWDEGPEVGGDNGPYRQSERLPIYAEAARALREEGAAYDCYCTPEELAERRRASGSEAHGYDGFCRHLGADRLAVWQAQGRNPVLRFRMPDEPVVVDDLVYGQITFPADKVPDYAILRANGDPLHALTNPLDDAMMGITHVLRDEDLMSSTPRQVPLHQTLQRLGVGAGPPLYAHLPLVLGDDDAGLSRDDPRSGLLEYVEQGFLPEGLLNYLALLGWDIGDGREVFTIEEMATAFDVRRVSRDPARFDLDRLEAVNSAHMRQISLPDLTERVIPFLADAGLVNEPLSTDQRRLLDAALPLVAARMSTLSEAETMLGFLFVDEADFVRVDEIDDDGRAVVQSAHDALASGDDWTAPAIEAALLGTLGDQEGAEAGLEAFAPVRVAVTGRQLSPPVVESLVLLGRDRSLARLGAALA